MASVASKRKYTMHAGNVIGQSDDDSSCFAASAEEALAKAVAWADNAWPDSDVRYSAVVWVERDGEVAAQQDVVIAPDGSREE